jgi:hypothetical protein
MLQAPGHDELLWSDQFGAPELIADDGDALFFPVSHTEREILFYLAGEAAGARGAMPTPLCGERHIRKAARAYPPPRAAWHRY